MYLTAMLANGALSVLLYQLLVFSLSIFLLAKSSEVVITSCVEIADITNIGKLAIGAVILSVATGLPEMAVSFSAIASGNPEISIGNILGSNITNLGLVLAIPAIMSPIKIEKDTFERLPNILFMSSMIPLLFLTMEEIAPMVGVLLIGAFIYFVMYSFKKKISFKFPDKKRGLLETLMLPTEFYKACMAMIAGLVVVMLSSTFVVSSSSDISSMIGIEESVIGATIIAIGTSLPELSVSLTAIKSKHNELAIGNAIGSCLINITLILGVISIISTSAIPLKIFSTLLFFVIGITLIAWYFFTTGRTLDRKEGIMLLLVYVLFLMTTFGVQITII